MSAESVGISSSNKSHHWVRGYPRASVFRVIAPQDVGWSLEPMVNLLRGIRRKQDVVALEMWGAEGVVSYGARTNNGDSLAGVLHSFFPQARVDRREDDETEEGDRGDWLHLDRESFALVQPLYLQQEAYLPLRIYDDRTIEQSKMDPLAGVIGVLSNATKSGSESAGERLGFRLVLKPARPDWNGKWRNVVQRRRDGEDRTQQGRSQDSGPSMSAMSFIGGLAGAGLLNYYLWDAGQHLAMVPANLGMLALGSLGLYLMVKFRGQARPYLDDQLLEEKLKSHAFRAEVQLVRVYRNEGEEDLALTCLDNLLSSFRSFEDPVGNSWAPGKVQKYRGEDIFQGEHRHPFLGGLSNLGWEHPRKAERSVLSSREVACVWHPPLGADEMASMERTAAGVLVPYLADLASGGEDSGPLVGKSALSNQDIRLPESAIRKHAIIVGRSGVGKSTMVKHILHHKLERKAQGKDDGAIVVIDPHADLVRDTLKMVPESIAHKVRLLDFGRDDRVPGINLVDPYLFTDRDRCVDTIVTTVKNLFEHWGGRLEDLLRRSLTMIYEFNKHPDTKPDEMLTMLDIMKLLDEGKQVGTGRDAKTVMTNWQRDVLERVEDPRLKEWFNAYLNWPRDTRAEAVGPVHSRVGTYAQNQKASVVMGQRRSSILLSDILSEGMVLLVSTASGTVGEGPAALMGGTMVSLVESALRDQEKLPTRERKRCLLVCDEFQTLTGANWEGMLAEIRKYGCSLMLATQSLARLDNPERKLKAGILGNTVCIVGYQMSAEDARIISAEMDDERVEPRFLVNLDPHHCYVRINSDERCYPAFSMATNAPPDMTIDQEVASRSEAAVVAAMKDYIVDLQETRLRMIQELNDAAREDKLSMGSEQPAAVGLDSVPQGKGAPQGKSRATRGEPVGARVGSTSGAASGAASGEDRAGPPAPPGLSGVSQKHSRADSPNPFNQVKAVREEKGALRGIDRGVLEDSVMSREMQESLMRVPRNDGAFKAIMDKHLGDRLKAERSHLERRMREEYLQQINDLKGQISSYEARDTEESRESRESRETEESDPGGVVLVDDEVLGEGGGRREKPVRREMGSVGARDVPGGVEPNSGAGEGNPFAEALSSEVSGYAAGPSAESGPESGPEAGTESGPEEDLGQESLDLAALGIVPESGQPRDAKQLRRPLYLRR